MGRLFGTDGVRGVAGRDLTARLAMDLATAGAAVLSRADASRRPVARMSACRMPSGTTVAAEAPRTVTWYTCTGRKAQAGMTPSRPSAAAAKVIQPLMRSGTRGDP